MISRILINIFVLLVIVFVVSKEVIIKIIQFIKSIPEKAGDLLQISLMIGLLILVFLFRRDSLDDNYKNHYI